MSKIRKHNEKNRLITVRKTEDSFSYKGRIVNSASQEGINCTTKFRKKGREQHFTVDNKLFRFEEERLRLLLLSLSRILLSCNSKWKYSNNKNALVLLTELHPRIKRIMPLPEPYRFLKKRYEINMEGILDICLDIYRFFLIEENFHLLQEDKIEYNEVRDFFTLLPTITVKDLDGRKKEVINFFYINRIICPCDWIPNELFRLKDLIKPVNNQESETVSFPREAYCF